MNTQRFNSLLLKIAHLQLIYMNLPIHNADFL